MVKKLKKLAEEKKTASPLTGAVKDSAQQIWLAGLGAFAKAQAEGGKMFETLVKEGLGLQRKTQTLAEEKLSETTTRLADIAGGLTSGLASGMASKATGIGSMATGQWDKLENIFEDRVSKALNKLGVPSSKDVAALVARVDALTLAVQKLSTKTAVPAKQAPVAPKKVTTKAKAAKPSGVPATQAASSVAVKTTPATKRAPARKAVPVVAAPSA